MIVKKIINGIKTTGTEITLMSRTAVRFKMKYSTEKIMNPFHLTMRASL